MAEQFEYLTPKISEIHIGDRRPATEDAVRAIAESIKAIGLKTPITIRRTGPGRYELVTGRHRLGGAVLLGWERIPAYVVECSEVDARLWEISENLHRAELTALERSEHVAEWIRLTEAQSSQVATNESKRDDGRGHRPEGGVRAAERELGLSHDAGRRAVKIDSLTLEAKEAAREEGLEDNQKALLQATRYKGPQAQVDAIRSYHETANQKPPSEDAKIEMIIRAYNALSSYGQDQFLDAIGATRS